LANYRSLVDAFSTKLWQIIAQSHKLLINRTCLI